MGMPPQSPPPYPDSRDQRKAQRAQWKAQREQWKIQSRMQREFYRAQFRGSSRGSLLGPIFLIVIGVFSLLATLHRIDIAYFWQWYGHWWPLLLIGAGVLLALETVAFAAHARVRLGGGVIMLLLILAVIGITASHNRVNWSAVGEQLNLGNDVDLSQMFGDKHQATEQIAHPIPADSALLIQNPHGNVTITSDAADNGQMQLTLDKTVYSNSDSEAHRRLDAFEPLITSNGTLITVHMPSSDSQTADMEIRLPANIAVEVRAAHGDVTINGRQAQVSVNADHGDVQLAGIRGAVHVTMHQGDFSASGVQGDVTLNGHMNDVTLSQISGAAALDGDFFGDVRLEKVHGPLHLHTSRTDIRLAQLAGSLSLDGDDLNVENATGPIAISTTAKDVALSRIHGEARVKNSNGSVEVTALDPLAAMNIENRNGSVQVTVPADSKFSVAATAVDGEVHTDFNLSTENGNNHCIVSGSVGGGGPLLHITAEKGDITLHKD